ncbi:MAG: hypothetical protein WCJ64_00950 [Rhodospirillaceae bacterium]
MTANPVAATLAEVLDGLSTLKTLIDAQSPPTAGLAAVCWTVGRIEAQIHEAIELAEANPPVPERLRRVDPELRRATAA